MTVDEIAKAVGGTVVVGSDQSADTFYAGDFLSRVMGKAPSGCAWFTVMNNVNVVGVAVLADIKTIVLCEGAAPSDEMTAKCREEGIGLITTPLAVYEACVGVK